MSTAGVERGREKTVRGDQRQATRGGGTGSDSVDERGVGVGSGVGGKGWVVRCAVLVETWVINIT